MSLRLAIILTLIFSVACGAPVTRRRSLNDHREAYNSTHRRVGDFNPIKKKISLLTFFNEAPYGGEDLAIVASEELRKELSRTKEYVLDPTAADMFGNSKEIYSGGGVKLAQMSRKAKIAGVNLVVFGRVIEARVRQKSDEIGIVRKAKSLAETKVEVKIFDVHSNKELFSDVFVGDVVDDNYRFYLEEKDENLSYRQDLLRYSVRVAMRKAIPKLLDTGTKLDWVGRVAKIIGTKIYINAGRDSGIHVGDILKVITEGAEVFDPESGALIGISQGEVKGTIEITDYFGGDGSVAILHSGGSVTEGDFVQLY